MSDWLLRALGAGLLVLAASDVFLTGFHPSARTGPVVRVLSRTIWALFRSVAGCRDRPRERLLSLAGPLIALATPVAWLALLGTGFALIYYPSVDAFSSQLGIGGPGWAEAVYYSGYVLFTLGLGDVVATGTTLRLLTVLEAGAGFGIFTMAVAYVLTLYGQQAEQTALANTIGNTLGGTDVDWSRSEPDVRERANDFAFGVARRLELVNATQKQYPVLRYFRQPSEADALPQQIGRLLVFLRRLEREREPERFPPFSPLLVLRRALDNYLEEARTHFVPATVRVAEASDEDAREVQDRDRDREMRRLLAYLCYSPMDAETTE